MCPSPHRQRPLPRAVLALPLLLATLVAVPSAQAGEIVPAIGLTRAVDGDETNVFGSLAVRGNLASILQSEVAVGYRSESLLDDNLRLRMWPVTASLWLRPVPTLYAGAGVGWYHLTFDYDQDALPVEDETRQEFGVHVGGGLNVPLASSVGLDLQGRYVMMREQESRLVPERFDPDFWTTTLGLSFRF